MNLDLFFKYYLPTSSEKLHANKFLNHTLLSDYFYTSSLINTNQKQFISFSFKLYKHSNNLLNNYIHISYNLLWNTDLLWVEH